MKNNCVGEIETGMISDIMGNQSYGELKRCAEDRANWMLGQLKTCSKAEK